MFLQAHKKLLAVQNFVLRVINNNCSELKACIEGPRRDKRVNISLSVHIIPLVDGECRIADSFYAITRELSTTGVGIVLDRQRALDKVLIGFRIEDEMTYLHARAKHLSPIKGGFFYHLGLEMTEIVPIDKYPELEALLLY